MEFELRDFFFFQPSAGRAGGASSDPDVRREASFIGKGLRVEMKASHAGMVNLNKVMYSPTGMDRSAVSWVFPQQRPVEIHHDDMADPVGRVIGAKFVPHSFHPEVQSDASAIKEIFLDAHDTDSLFTAIGLLEESGVLKEESWAGVGTLVLDCVITDSSAVEKILDGRYLGVSVSQHPKEAFCSICRKDWVKEGPCEHERGKIDEESGKEMYLVVGETRYKEVSYVNHPADEHATGDARDITDFISLEDSLQTKITGARVLEDPVYTLMDSTEIASLIAPASEESSEESLPLEQDGEAVEEVEETPVEEEETTTDEAALTLEEALRVLFEDEDNLTEEMVELINEALEEDVKDADAKLTTEKRKRLAQKTFCGPGRSFPVPDCCFSGNQKVSLLDGREVEISEIVEMVERGEPVWVYSFDLVQKAIVPREVTGAWLARRNAPVLEVTLDNGEKVVCTENHPFLTRDLIYKRADRLQIKESLLPLYRRTQSLFDREEGYEQVKQPWYGTWEYTHRLVAREFYQRAPLEKEVVHHKDQDRVNNVPSNLEIVDQGTHCKLHQVSRHFGHREFTAEEKQVRSRFMKNRMATILGDEELRSSHLKSLSQARRTYDWDNPNNEVGLSGITLRDAAVAVSLGVKRNFVASLLGIEPHTLTSWIRKANITDFYLTDKAVQIAKDFVFLVHEVDLDSVWVDLSEGLSYVQLSQKYKMDRATIKGWFERLGYETSRIASMVQKEGTSLESLYSSWRSGEISKTQIQQGLNVSSSMLNNAFKKVEQASAYNHKVVSIEFAGHADVFDLEVADTHNFALSAGVFVHNSHYTAALRLLGRYKGPGDKSRIRSCIESKGKKLGCSSEKKDYDEEVITSLITQVQDLENEGLLVLGMTILDMAEELNIKVPCPNCRKMKAKLEEVSVSSLIKELKESWKQDKEVLPIEKLISDDPISLEASEETELDVEVSIDEEVHPDGEETIIQEEVEESEPETDGMANIPEGVVTLADAEGEVDEIIPQKLVDDLKTFYRKFGEAYVIDYFTALQTTGKISKDLALAKVLNLVR